MKNKIKIFNLMCEIEFMAALFFYCQVIVFSAVIYFKGIDYIKISTILEIFIMSFYISILHYIIYIKDNFIKLNMYMKAIIHYILILIGFIVAFKYFNWSYILSTRSFSMYVIIFTLIYIFLFLSIFLCYKLSGQRLNKRLAIYKHKKDNKF